MAEEAPIEEINPDARPAPESKDEPKRSASPAFMLRADVIEFTTLSKSVLRRLMMRDEFPKPVKLSPNRVAWRRAEVEEWVNSRERVSEPHAA